MPRWPASSPSGRGWPRPVAGSDALIEAVGSLQGAALPASVLESDILPARVAGFRAADLDALCTSGEVVWVGAGALGSTDGRVRLLFRDQAGLLVPAPDAGAIDGGELAPVHAALLAQLSDRGASFWPELVQAVAAAEQPYDEPTVRTALWDLVWGGLVTNDSLAPLRAAVGGRSRRRGGGDRSAGAIPRPRRGLVGRARMGTRPDPGGLSRLGPPAVAGRWSLVAPLLLPLPTATEAAHAQALQLLERHGVLTREAALGEGIDGGFAAVYPVLKALEERGQVRRGYFVEGLGAAQFALPGAVDRLRAARDPGEGDLVPLVLAATDPAQPYGAALAWPESAGRPSRSAGAFVVSVAGQPVAELERGGRSLSTFAAALDHPHWAEGLTGLVKDGRLRKLEITKIDGGPPSSRRWPTTCATPASWTATRDWCSAPDLRTPVGDPARQLAARSTRVNRSGRVDARRSMAVTMSSTGGRGRGRRPRSCLGATRCCAGPALRAPTMSAGRGVTHHPAGPPAPRRSARRRRRRCGGRACAHRPPRTPPTRRPADRARSR